MGTRPHHLPVPAFAAEVIHRLQQYDAEHLPGRVLSKGASWQD